MKQPIYKPAPFDPNDPASVARAQAEASQYIAGEMQRQKHTFRDENRNIMWVIVAIVVAFILVAKHFG